MPGMSSNISGAPFQPKVDPKQKLAQAQTADQAAFSRDQQGADFRQGQSQLMTVLDGLKGAGYLGDSTSSSSSSGSSGAGGGGGAAVGPWTPKMPGAPGAAAAPVAPLADPTNAGNAAFARAKDRVGNSLQGLTKALSNQFSGRNMQGGTAEINAVGNVLASGNHELADVAREQAIQESGDANDFARTRYEGDISQRGQDLSALSAINSQSLTARGQDIAALDAREARNVATANSKKPIDLGSIMGLWNAFGGASGARY